MNDEYRRGTVLGLTVAEIFILLIFLILFALLGLASTWDERETKHRIDRRTLRVWSDVIEKFQAPEEIETLVRKAKIIEQDRERIFEENAELRGNVAALHEEQKRLHGENARLSVENSGLMEDQEALIGEIEELRDENTKPSEENTDLRRNIEMVREERKRLRDENARLSAENSGLREEREALTEEIEELRDENTRLSDSNTALRGRAAEERRRTDRIETDLETLRHKGQNPPCWYETVADGGRKREKAHYIFNIAVHDEYMVVLPHPIPPGQADDDRGRPYTEEADDLRLEEIPYGVPLSYGEVTRHMERIRDLGKMRKVRSYRCIFWVKVWDKTSPEAKARWKEAHDGVLEGLFGTYQVKDEPWLETR